MPHSGASFRGLIQGTPIPQRGSPQAQCRGARLQWQCCCSKKGPTLQALAAPVAAFGRRLWSMRGLLSIFPQLRQILGLGAAASAGAAHAHQRREAPNEPMTTKRAAEILGITEDASPAEIRTAHRKLMGKMHPDKDGTIHWQSGVAVYGCRLKSRQRHHCVLPTKWQVRDSRVFCLFLFRPRRGQAPDWARNRVGQNLPLQLPRNPPGFCASQRRPPACGQAAHALHRGGSDRFRGVLPVCNR